MRIQTFLVATLVILLSATTAVHGAKPELSKDRLFGEYSGRVAFVDDGDTLDAYVGKGLYRIRLSDIDAPEVNHCARKSLIDCKLKGQPHALAATDVLKSLVLSRDVLLVCKDYDSRYQRNVCRVFVNGLDVNRELVNNGVAWHSKKYSKDHELGRIFELAKTQQRGLWGSPLAKDHVAPWDWRQLCWKQGICPHAN